MQFSHRSLRATAIGLTAGLLLASLAACSSISAEGAQNARKAVAASATLYASARISFQVYANLPRCEPPAGPKPCSDPAKVVQVGSLLLEARDQLDLARQLVNQLPSSTTVGELPAEGKLLLEQTAASVGEAQIATGALK